VRGQGDVRCFVFSTLVSGVFSFGLIVPRGCQGVDCYCFLLFW